MKSINPTVLLAAMERPSRPFNGHLFAVEWSMTNNQTFKTMEICAHLADAQSQMARERDTDKAAGATIVDLTADDLKVLKDVEGGYCGIYSDQDGQESYVFVRIRRVIR